MFRTMRNKITSGTPDTRTAVQAVRDRLPPGWSVELRAPRGDELALDLRAVDGRATSFRVVVRKQIQPRDVPNLLRQTSDPGQRVLVVAPFLSPRARELLVEGGASYADSSGNLRLVASTPAIFLEGRGADRDPDRQPRALRSLKGAAAGRVVRALCDFKPPYGVRELADASGTPLGTVSRVVTLLEQEALLTRNDDKRIVDVDWAALIARWASDYSVTGSNLLRSYLEPRGLTALGAKLGKLERYAVTGSLAGPGIAPARLAVLYVDDARTAAETLELVPAEAGANVWLLEPFDVVVFERTSTRQLTTSPGAPPAVVAAPSQVAADLLTSPGRGPQEGEALIERMKGAEDDWRSRP